MATIASAADNPDNRQPLNKEAVKILAMAIGIREAARRMGLDEHRVLKWSQRDPNGPWMSSPAQKQLSTPSITGNTERLSCPQIVLKPSEALADVLAEDSKRTKVALASASRRAAERLSDMDGDEILLVTPAMKDVATVADKVHGWNAGSGASVAVQVNVMNSI